MHVPQYQPRRTGHSDVFSAFILIMSIAIGLQAYSEIDHYAELRSEGIRVEGYWAGRFTNPADGEPYGIYYFTVDDHSYNAQQALGSDIAYTGSGEPVQIIYLPSDPSQSRIAGTEHYGIGSVLKLVICAIVVAFALQYLVAYYTSRSAWALKLAARSPQLRRWFDLM